MKRRTTRTRFKPQQRPTAEPELNNLPVSRPSDALEKEADRTAHQITESATSKSIQPSKRDPLDRANERQKK